MNIRQSIRALLAASALVAAAGVAQAQTIAYADPGTTNLRSGPGTNFARIGSVYGGMQIYVSYCQYAWCLVTVNGQQGWMAESRLNFADVQSPVVVVPQPQYAPRPYYVPQYEPYRPSFSFGFGLGDSHSYRSRDRHRDRYHNDRREEHTNGHLSEGPEGYVPLPKQSNGGIIRNTH